MNGLSLFANVGIAETYLKDVGVDIVVANELIEDRARFYSHLYPSCNMICGDITDDEVRRRVISAARSNNCKFIMATPPCQGMSLAGSKDPDDARNFLIAYAIDIIEELEPEFVLIENVKQQLKTYVKYNGEKILIPDMIEKRLGKKYNICVDLLNTEKFGVPQKRLRALFLLARKDKNIHWTIPETNDEIVTLREAIGDLPSLDPELREQDMMYKFPDYEKKRQAGLKVSKWHYARPHVWRNVEVMMHTPTGCAAKKNKVFYPKNSKGKMVGGSGSAYMRMDWDQPAPTVTTYNHTISSFHNVHPGNYIGKDEQGYDIYSDARVLTVFELMRVTTLPDDWDIPDWASENLVRTVIGEGIPPLAIKKIVEALHLK